MKNNTLVSISKWLFRTLKRTIERTSTRALNWRNGRGRERTSEQVNGRTQLSKQSIKRTVERMSEQMSKRAKRRNEHLSQTVLQDRKHVCEMAGDALFKLWMAFTFMKSHLQLFQLFSDLLDIRANISKIVHGLLFKSLDGFFTIGQWAAKVLQRGFFYPVQYIW